MIDELGTEHSLLTETVHSFVTDAIGNRTYEPRAVHSCSLVRDPVVAWVMTT